jgi:tRNA nucleotidyltransferase (CCA-adding enzyme)
MKLPEHVHFCLTRLESAGYPCYAVGGCVRDALLGLTPQDYDLCTAALPEETEAVFADYKLVLAGKSTAP